ncbi:MAG: hypothetical protein SFZ03_11940 [Candidatus Melainabacteria bacterium]|nr:hypothetical protein [Candidatus Melainabacteria bacterium]
MSVDRPTPQTDPPHDGLEQLKALLLQQLGGNSLSAAEAHRLAQALSQNDATRDALLAYQAQIQPWQKAVQQALAEDATQVCVPDDLTDRIMQRVSATHPGAFSKKIQPGGFWQSPIRWGALVAGILALLLSSPLWNHLTQQESDPLAAHPTARQPSVLAQLPPEVIAKRQAALTTPQRLNRNTSTDPALDDTLDWLMGAGCVDAAACGSGDASRGESSAGDGLKDWVGF